MADLEAELDDPYANGGWEELEDAEVTSEQAPAGQAAPIATPRTEEENKEGSQSRVAVEAEDNAPSQNHIGTSDNELPETNGDHNVDQAADDLGYLNIDDSPSPSESADSNQGPALAGATVPPMDIIARKPLPSSSSASRIDQLDSRLDRTMTRTPSPNGLGSSLGVDASTGVEGPMTPRNDAGPFIFDGSGGRPSDVQLAAIATMNLNAAANTPPPTHTEKETA